MSEELKDQLEDMFEEAKEKIDTKEERTAIWKKVVSSLSEYRYWIGGTILVVAIGSFANSNKEELAKQLEPKVVTVEVEKVVYKDRVLNMGDFKCVDLSKMYTIAKKDVTYKKGKYEKLAKGLSLEDGYEVYITEYTPKK